MNREEGVFSHQHNYSPSTPDSPVPLSPFVSFSKLLVGTSRLVPASEISVFKIVVRHVHPLLRLRAIDPRRPLLRAWETAICGRKGGFPHLGELVEDVGDFGLVGVVVHEDDDALASQDHGAEGGPGGDVHGDLRGDVGELGEARGFEGGGVVAYADEVGVAN